MSTPKYPSPARILSAATSIAALSVSAAIIIVAGSKEPDLAAAAITGALIGAALIGIPAAIAGACAGWSLRGDEITTQAAVDRIRARLARRDADAEHERRQRNQAAIDDLLGDMEPTS